MSDFNILRPELVWIKDRCYRKLPVRETVVNPEEIEDDLYTSHHPTTYEEDNFSAFDIKHVGNKFWTTRSIPACLSRFVVGTKHAVVNRIQEDTCTKINISHAASNGGSNEITITGKDKRNVGLACSRIITIVANARGRQPFTHFISLPMNSENLKQSFLDFKKEVLSHSHEIRGLDESIFQNPNQLHLTLTTLILLDDTERGKAATTLHKFKDDVRTILRGKPLKVAVRGIEYMNDDPSEVDVLYAKVQDCDGDARLQILADNIMNKFEKTELAKKQYDKVKLHITLLNTRFRSGEDLSKSVEYSGTAQRKSFDACFLLENYADHDFGTTTISDIHLSVRYTTGKDGYYVSSAILKLPT